MKLLLLLSVAIFVAGCDHITPESKFPKPKFARERNPDRTKRLLPIIEDSWQNCNQDNNRSEAAWRAPGPDPVVGRASHTGKKILYPEGMLEAEEDYYYSGKMFDGSTIDPDSGELWEQLTIQYDYRHPESPWSCYFIHAGGMDTISLPAAEDILQSWGLQRLTPAK